MSASLIAFERRSKSEEVRGVSTSEKELRKNLNGISEVLTGVGERSIRGEV